MEKQPLQFGLVGKRVTARVGWESHRHLEIELNFVEQGGLDYLYGGRLVGLESGRLAVFWAALPHRITCLEPETVLHWITLPLAVFLGWRLPDPFTRRILEGAFLIDPQLSRFSLDQALFQNWQQDLFLEQEAYREVMLLELQARLKRMALAFVGREDRSKTPSGEIPGDGVGQALTPGNEPQPGFVKARRMAEFIALHSTELITVTQIAQAAGLHPNYAMTLFKRHFQISLGEYLAQTRVAHSQRLLLISDLPIQEVARQAGFSSPSQFYETFKQQCGVSPGKYRATHLLR
jgi:AraC family transcriptional regulator, melibiose operon regulatory protein